MEMLELSLVHALASAAVHNSDLPLTRFQQRLLTMRRQPLNSLLFVSVHWWRMQRYLLLETRLLLVYRLLEWTGSWNCSDLTLHIWLSHDCLILTFSASFNFKQTSSPRLDCLNEINTATLWSIGMLVKNKSPLLRCFRFTRCKAFWNASVSKCCGLVIQRVVL